jgi:tape measure domain-containing protein
VAADDLVIRASVRNEMSAQITKMRKDLAGLAAQVEVTDKKSTVLGRGMDRLTAGFGRTARALGVTDSALARGHSRMTEFGRGVSGVSAKLSTGAAVLGRYGGAAAAALGVGAAAATAWGLATASGLEQSGIAFKTLLGSQQASNAYMAELRTLAQNTPFALPELTKGAQRLMAMGFTADKAKEALIAAGDVAASMGTGAAGIDRITLAFGQMMSTGRIQGDEMRQLNEAGIDGYKMLADAHGLSVAEIRKQGEAGLLDAATSIPILIKGINARVGGMMEEQSKTLAGQWARLKETVQMGIADALQPAMPQIKAFITDLTAAVGPLVPVFAMIAVALMPAIKAIADALVPLAPLIGEFATMAGQVLAEVLVALAPSLPGMAQGFIDIAGAVVVLLPFITTFAEIVAWVLSHEQVTVMIVALAAALWLVNFALMANPWTLVAIAVAAVVTGVVMAIQHFGGFKGTIDALWGAVQTAAHWLWEMFLKFTPLGQAIQFIADKFGGWEAILGRVKDFLGQIVSGAGAAWDKLKSVGGWIPGVGDTPTSHAVGSGGGLDSTMRMHAALMASSGSGIKVSNALVGGGGMGRGSGDHQAGRALDLVGSGLGSYAQQLKAAGGYAAMHGNGKARHLHAVYPSGDTNRSMARSTAARGGDTINLPQGAIVVYANNEMDIETGVKRGIAAYLRDRGERV